ncbi:MAG: hypothetical protein RDU30_09720 [Desulfovibrionaceae bacterium]|nr:hypothetical protein [Desulfovibrionaceae bacterium]
MATVDRTALLAAVEMAALAVKPGTSRSNAAGHAAVWLVPAAADNELAVEASDGSVEFVGHVAAQCGDFELCGVNAATLHVLLKKLPPGELLLTQGPGDSLTIRTGPRRYRLATVDAGWRQPVTSPKDGGDVGPDAARAVTLAAYAVARDEALGTQACLHLAPGAGPGECQAQGLDGHQFVRAVFDARELAEVLPEAGVLVPGRHIKTLILALGQGGGTACLDGKRLWVAWGDGRLGLALGSGTFPDTQPFLDRCADPAFSAVVDRQDVLAALARLAVVLDEADRSVRLAFEAAGRVTLTASNGDGEEQMDAVISRGELWPVAIAPKDVAGIFGLIETDRVRLAFSLPTGPILVTAVVEDGDDPAPVRTVAVTMPMKIPETTYDAEGV